MSRVYSKGPLKIMIISAIMFIGMLFIPFVIADGKVIFTYKLLPIFGDNSILQAQIYYVTNFLQIITIPITDTVSDIVRVCFSIGNYLFFSILLFNVVFGLLLTIIRIDLIRIIIHAISILLGIAVCILSLLAFIYLVSLVVVIIKYPTGYFFYTMIENGAISSIAGVVLSSCLINYQFKSFRRGYTIKYETN